MSPARLLEQVENTAAWALSGEGASWRARLLAASELEAHWRTPEARSEYLGLLLAAHFSTCGTMVPTDVDAHIRHHIWEEIETRDELEACVRVVDEAAAWDPRAVSARSVEVEGVGLIAGYAGEVFSVRAGALGRALTLGADDVADAIAAAIDDELAREAAAIERARAARDVGLLLRLATISAHNCGDLSRVIEAWHRRTHRKSEMLARFARLGHEGADRYGGAHHVAGHLNKEVMASENHRHLPLRAARPLRRSRALLVPFAPFLDPWGERVAAELDDERDRASVLGALVAGLDASVDRWGYLRGIAGLHRASAGGVDRLAPFIPARLRGLVARGPVRDAIRTDEARFLARLDKTAAAAMASYRAAPP